MTLEAPGWLIDILVFSVMSLLISTYVFGLFYHPVLT